MRLPTILLMSALLLLTACAGDHSASTEDRLRVVATTTQIGDFAANVGGGRIHLTVLLTPNQDAHDFELKPSQLRAVSGADLVLRNGLGLDDFLDKALESSSATVSTVSEGIQAMEPGQDERNGERGGDRSQDPHVWFSVDNARRMVENIRDALNVQDSPNADFYTENASAYLATLEALDAEIRGLVEAVPLACRKLVTNHDVLGYYAAAYGFQLVGSIIPATTTGAQASAVDIAEVVTTIQEENVPAIFAEASVNPDLINQVGREAGVRVIDDLYGDSLGPEGSDGATYVDMMRSNTTKIVEALTNCED